MILLLCLLVFKKINAECRETKGERERERNCVLVCAFQGGISSRKSKKAWLIWLGLLFLAYRDYVITWKIKNFWNPNQPITIDARDSWCRSPYPINVWWWWGGFISFMVPKSTFTFFQLLSFSFFFELTRSKSNQHSLWNS